MASRIDASILPPKIDQISRIATANREVFVHLQHGTALARCALTAIDGIQKIVLRMRAEKHMQVAMKKRGPKIGPRMDKSNN
jgi:hypothetical protein